VSCDTKHTDLSTHVARVSSLVSLYSCAGNCRPHFFILSLCNTYRPLKEKELRPNSLISGTLWTDVACRRLPLIRKSLFVASLLSFSIDRYCKRRFQNPQTPSYTQQPMESDPCFGGKYLEWRENTAASINICCCLRFPPTLKRIMPNVKSA
jgi:hypothetical protein